MKGKMMNKWIGSGSFIVLLGVLSTSAQAKDLIIPETPKVDKVLPQKIDPVKATSPVFFTEDLETIPSLPKRFQDHGLSDGRFLIASTDALSGKKSIEQIYLPKEKMKGDPGSAGWAWRFFGDNPLTRNIPAEQKKPYTRIFARWYHKFPTGFQAQDGRSTFPPKMARMGCFKNGWKKTYGILFWIEGKDGHISIQRNTTAPGVHRKWLANSDTTFALNTPLNLGRWIHLELGVTLGKGKRSDRIQAWADGMQICDINGDDLAAGWRGATLNGMQWDTYWNGGSPVKQSRFYDDLVLSTEPIGPLRVSVNPTIAKAPFAGGTKQKQKTWKIEIAAGAQGELTYAGTVDNTATKYDPPKITYKTVWQGSVKGAGNTVTVNGKSGKFVGTRKGKKGLANNQLYFIRLRQQANSGNWSKWSAWHSGFATDWQANTKADKKTAPRGYLLQHVNE